MTWLKIPEDFPEDCAKAGLSDAAVRTHLEGLVWAMRRENDGRILRSELRRFADTEGDPKAAAAELVAAQFWRETGKGWVIVHTMEHQPEAEVIAARRAMNAERQRNSRRRKAGLEGDDPPPRERQSRRDKHRDETRDKPRDETRDGVATRRVTRSGAERTGTDLLEEGDNPVAMNSPRHTDGFRDEHPSDALTPSVATAAPLSEVPALCAWCQSRGLTGGCPECGRTPDLAGVGPAVATQGR
jgi:hypothetical protein